MLDLLIEADGLFSQKRIQRDRNTRRNTERNTRRNTNIDSESFLESESLEEENKKERVRAKARNTLDENWCIGLEELSYAKEHGFSQDQAQGMGQAFRDHHRSKGNRMADWSAAWRMWVRNEVKFSNRFQQRNGGNNGKRTSLVEAWDKLSKFADAEAENSEGGKTFGEQLSLGPVRGR